MSTIREIFKIYGPKYLERFGDRMPRNHKKVIHAIGNCREGSLGKIVYGCQDCHSKQSVPCSCGNRHCPTCQQEKGDEWLQRQMEKLLPAHYFLLTVTLPEQFRNVVRSHQKIAYAALFSCIHEALKKLAKDKRFVGSSRIGFLAVLHTWGGMLQYHPHLHLIIPGGALSEKGDEWLPSRKDLFVHTKPLARIFKGKFKDAMKKASLFSQIDASVWKQEWVVDSQAVGNGQTSLRYLARYVFRVAISNNRIKSIEDGIITFQYKDRDQKKWKTMRLEAMEFIRRFLQHVLPCGFMKIRHYGFLSSNPSLSIEQIRELISRIHDVIHALVPKFRSPKKRGFVCRCCGQALKFIAFVKPTLACRGPS